MADPRASTLRRDRAAPPTPDCGADRRNRLQDSSEKDQTQAEVCVIVIEPSLGGLLLDFLRAPVNNYDVRSARYLDRQCVPEQQQDPSSAANKANEVAH
jgi:hypothetical protein